MLQLPSFGERVKVWPALGVRVQDGADRFGVFLLPDGREVIWDSFFHRRWLDGSIHLHDPRPASRAAAVATTSSGSSG
jgi:hypothetical protein